MYDVLSLPCVFFKLSSRSFSGFLLHLVSLLTVCMCRLTILPPSLQRPAYRLLVREWGLHSCFLFCLCFKLVPMTYLLFPRIIDERASGFTFSETAVLFVYCCRLLVAVGRVFRAAMGPFFITFTFRGKDCERWPVSFEALHFRVCERWTPARSSPTACRSYLQSLSHKCHIIPPLFSVRYLPSALSWREDHFSYSHLFSRFPPQLCR